MASDVERQSYREWQREEESDSRGRGYSQAAVAGLLVEYHERELRLEDHPGRRGLAACAVLLDVDYALDPKAGRVPPEIIAQAREWMDGPEASPDGPQELTDEADGPQLVESIPDLQTAILEAHTAESHLVLWNGKWTAGRTLMRMLDDTRTVRRIAGAMSRKATQVPRRFVASVHTHNPCHACGSGWDAGTVGVRIGHLLYHGACAPLHLVV